MNECQAAAALLTPWQAEALSHDLKRHAYLNGSSNWGHDYGNWDRERSVPKILASIRNMRNTLSSLSRYAQKPALDVPADQELNSLRPGQALVGAEAIDQAEEKPSGTGNFLTPVAIHDVLAEASEKVNFDWPHSLPIERIKAGLTEIAVAILLFAGLVAICLQRF